MNSQDFGKDSESMHVKELRTQWHMVNIQVAS